MTTANSRAARRVVSSRQLLRPHHATPYTAGASRRRGAEATLVCGARQPGGSVVCGIESAGVEIEGGDGDAGICYNQ